MKKIKKKEIFILAAALALLLSSNAYSQAVVDRYKLGHFPEGISSISEGKFAGKFAFADGWWVYIFDINTGTYEKLFCQADIPLGDLARGICFISKGDFAGNFLLGNAADRNFLFIVSPSGALISKVTAVNFNWDKQNEGITEITSGPFQGKFAIICFRREEDNPYTPHIFIFRIESADGTVKAYLERDIGPTNLGTYPLGIGFLPDDYPDPAYRNHLVISDLEVDLNGFRFLRVFDCNGNLKRKYPIDSMYEGLAYINKGSYSGKLMVYSGGEEHIWVMNLDGSEKIPFYTGVGIGLSPHLLSIAWLENTNQFLIGRWLGAPNNTFYLVSRLGPDNWRKDDEKQYPDIYEHLDITELIAETNYYLLGFQYSGQRLFEVHRLDSNFNFQEKYSIPNYYPGKYCRTICYIPGETPAADRFALVWSNERKIYLFDKTFSLLAQIINLEEKVNRITDIYYDAANKKYYLLDSGNLIRKFDLNWNEIDQCDVSDLAPRGFLRLTKITSGDLKDNFLLLDMPDLELVIINFEYQKAVSQLENLIEEIQSSKIQQGFTSQDSSVEDELKNSLIEKLKNAINSIEKGNINAAINQIRAFQNEVQANSGKKIPLDLADRWISISVDIIKDLENP